MQCQVENCPQEAQPREVRLHLSYEQVLTLRLCQFCAPEFDDRDLESFADDE